MIWSTSPLAPRPSYNRETGGTVAYVRIIDEDEAEGALARQYRAAKGRTGGRIYEIVKLHSLDAAALRASMQLYQATTTAEGAPLSRMEREMVAVVVSRANDCFY